MSTAGRPDPEYVKARRVLLDALEALAPHGSALVLVGAQAIYLHAGPGDLAVAPYTTDGDLCIQPVQLADSIQAETHALTRLARIGYPAFWIGADSASSSGIVRRPSR